MVLIFASLFFAGLIFCATFISRFFLVILEKLVCSSTKSLQCYCISRASKDCQSQVGRVRGISTEYRMVNGKVSTTCRCYTYVDMSVEYRPRETYYKYGKVSAEYRPIIGEKLSTDISFDTQPTYRPPYRPICWSSVGRYIG